jgi:hypothetical protein
MTASELKANVQATGSHFFERSSMRFFGDTMANYYVSSKPVTVETPSGSRVQCWELTRRRPVKHKMQAPAYFACDDFRRVLPRNEPNY